MNVSRGQTILLQFAADRTSIENNEVCLTYSRLLFIVVNFVGTSLQEIKVDCDIDERASIAITKKGKVWEVSGIE